MYDVRSLADCGVLKYLILMFRLTLFLLILSTIPATAQDGVYIRINLAGYQISDPKEAIVFSDAAIRKRTFYVVDDASERRVFKGTLAQSKSPRYGKLGFYYTLDFSALDKQGRYHIELGEARSRSESFSIGIQAYAGHADALLEFMRQQRCGYNPFFDVVCHEKDGRAMDGPMKDSSYVDVRGGWHDAGDQLKYLITASNATGRMLLAYKYFKPVFSDSFNDLGQPGANRIADVLDEAKWGLDWIHNLHPQPGQLFHQVGDDRDHIGWKLPGNDPSNYGWGKNSYRVAYYATGRPQGLGKYKSESTGIANIAGRSAAALALGHQVWSSEKLDEAYAMKCLSAAKELYRMAREQEGYQQGNSYGAPYRYNEDTWTDDMEWAAAELYRSTGDKTYLDDAIRYADMTNTLSWIEKDTTAHYQRYPFLNIAHFVLYDLVDETVKARLAGYYKKGIEMTMKRARSTPYNNGVPFIWCSNNLVVDLVLQIALYERMTGDRAYHFYMTSMRDWLFGRNPWGVSMFTGIPSEKRSATDVHTSTWALTKRTVRGGLVDGPIYYDIYKRLLGLHLTHDDEYADFQDSYVVYHDDIGDYSTNEPTMDGTACAVMMMALIEAGR